uniref:Uncharacterized protein n=1 Tax=Naja naja TaxID=35670 RepID=A0A8C6V8N9_NAJNA
MHGEAELGRWLKRPQRGLHVPQVRHHGYRVPCWSGGWTRRPPRFPSGTVILPGVEGRRWAACPPGRSAKAELKIQSFWVFGIQNLSLKFQEEQQTVVSWEPPLGPTSRLK